jgi:methylated-DNA-[protein]-cysteine S-methyltransferase
MKPSLYCIFATPFGFCGIAWREAVPPGGAWAVSSFQLPEATPELTEARIARISGAGQASVPPPAITHVVERVTKHLRGEIQDFRDVPVDLEGAEVFVQRVCEAIRAIPAGQTVTYGELGATLGQTSGARAVGRALGRNPIPLIIPCHRVHAAGGKPGGFSAHGGRITKAKLLALEGAVVNLCLELEMES